MKLVSVNKEAALFDTGACQMGLNFKELVRQLVFYDERLQQSFRDRETQENTVNRLTPFSQAIKGLLTLRYPYDRIIGAHLGAQQLFVNASPTFLDILKPFGDVATGTTVSVLTIDGRYNRDTVLKAINEINNFYAEYKLSWR